MNKNLLTETRLAPGRPKAAEIPLGDRSRYSADEGSR
jgi:hypothetical protein